MGTNKKLDKIFPPLKKAIKATFLDNAFVLDDVGEIELFIKNILIITLSKFSLYIRYNTYTKKDIYISP